MDKVTYNMSFAKVDESRRIVSGFATLNNLDKQKDIVSTEASIKAFKTFRGNVRELHSKIAAGRLIDYGLTAYHDVVTNKVYDGIFVRAYISKGAPDTWEKVLDGTLNGFSIGGEILDAEDTITEDGTMVRVIKEYELAELSLVDNPANELANVTSVEKAVGYFGEIQENIDEEELIDMTPRGVKKSAEDVVEEPVAEAVEESETVDESPVEETVVAETVDPEPVVEAPKDEQADETSSESDERVEPNSEAGDAAILAEVINELKALVIERDNKTNEIFVDVVDQLKELKAGVSNADAKIDTVQADLVGVKSTVSEFDKRVKTVEDGTAVRKSGDLGEVAQSKTQKKTGIWDGRFLTADL